MPLPLVQTNPPLVGLRRLTEPSQWVAGAESPANSGLPQKNPGHPSVRPALQRGESASGFRKVADLRVSCQPQVTRQPPRLTARRRPNRSATSLSRWRLAARNQLRRACIATPDRSHSFELARRAGTASKSRRAVGPKLEGFAWRLEGRSAEPDIALESESVRHKRLRDLCRIRSPERRRRPTILPGILRLPPFPSEKVGL